MRMLIKNGTVVNAHGSMDADVRITGELIDRIAPGLVPEPGEEVIDAAGMLVMPGGVDAHTHMDLLVGAARASDSFLTGSIAAACGGTTTIIDHMAFGPLGCDLMHQVDAYHVLADGKAVIDYGFHGVVDRVDEAILAELPDLVEAGITSVKFYLTYDRRLEDEQVIALLQRTGELGMLACVHCENHGILTYLRQKFVAEGKTDARHHALSRPAICEAEAIDRVAKLAHVAGDSPIYIVHTSSAEGLAAAQSLIAAPHPLPGALHPSAPHPLPTAQQADDELPLSAVQQVPAPHPLPANVHLETCPQYLTLDASAYDLPDHEGLKFVMSPPLRDMASREALWQGIADGSIEVVGTDHCPFFFTEKLAAGADDFTKCPNGAPGVELRLALMYSEGVVKRGMSPSTLVQVCSTAPAKRFGIFPRKGLLAAGSDADVVIFDPNRRLTVTKSMLHEHVDYTPYEGIELRGYPKMTISRGSIVMKDGEFTGQEGAGRYLKRDLPAWD